MTDWGTPLQGFTSYGSLGSYKLAVKGSWSTKSKLKCKPPLTVQLPQKRRGTCAASPTLSAAKLYLAKGPVEVTPPLPTTWPTEMNQTFTITAPFTGTTCSTRVVIKPCTLVCKWGADGASTLAQLPLPTGDCRGAALTARDLFEAQGTFLSVTPPLPAVFAIGSSSTHTISNDVGSCSVSVAVAACQNTCYLRVKLIKAQRSGKNAPEWQIRSVKMRVVDVSGSPVPNATVQIDWFVVSALSQGSSLPSLTNGVSMRVVSSSSNRASAGRGLLLVPASPKAARGELLRLQVTSVVVEPAALSSSSNTTCVWDARAPNFSSQDFVQKG